MAKTRRSFTHRLENHFLLLDIGGLKSGRNVFSYLKTAVFPFHLQSLSLLFPRSLSWCGEKSKERTALFLFCNVADWEQCWEVKWVFCSLTTETTLQCHQPGGGSPWLWSNPDFIHDNSLSSRFKGTVCLSVCGHAFKCEALLPPLLTLTCYNSVIEHFCFPPILQKCNYSQELCTVRDFTTLFEWMLLKKPSCSTFCLKRNVFTAGINRTGGVRWRDSVYYHLCVLLLASSIPLISFTSAVPSLVGVDFVYLNHISSLSVVRSGSYGFFF